MRKTDSVRFWQVLLPAVLAGFGLIIALATLGRTTQAAPLRDPDPDPSIRAITVTSAGVPVSDTHPFVGVSRSVYFNNKNEGVITLTFGISGTAPLSFTAGAAFNDPEAPRVTSTQAMTSIVVSYSVETGGGHWPAVNHVVTNANGMRQEVAITYTRDVTAPSVPTLITPTNGTITNAATVAFHWTEATDGQGSGVAGYNLDFGGKGYTTTVPTLTATLSGGVHTWTVRSFDHVGNTSAYADPWTLHAPFIFLPVVIRDRRLVNGNFETGDLSGWDRVQGPFQGHGTGQPQRVVRFGGSYSALLGDPTAHNGDIAVGYGYIAQTFEVDKRYVQIHYRVQTYDIVKGATTGRYFDTLEVSLNTRPDLIADSERNSRGCDTEAGTLNPTGLLIPSDGLAFCAGRAGSSADAGTFYDSGWRTVTLDLDGYQHKELALFFTIWSREYESPAYNDRGYYNTWGYIDDIQLTDSPSASSALGGDAPGIEVVPDNGTAYPTGAGGDSSPRRR